MDYETVIVERRGYIGLITLNRPEQLNTFSSQLAHDLNSALRELEQDTQIRVVVIKGAGRAFCAGIDVNELAGKDIVEIRAWVKAMDEHNGTIANMKKPVAPARKTFPRLLNEMGEVIEKELAKSGRRVLLIEGTMNNKLSPELVHVVAGHPPEAHVESLEILQKQLVVDVKGQSDVVVYGMGNNRDGYSKLSIINPILVRNLAMSYSFGLFQNIPLVRQGGIAIFVHPCKRQFDATRYASYVEVFEKLLPYNQDPFELWELYAEDYAHRPEYIHKYRYGHSFHGVHPLILWGQGAYGLRHLGKVFLAGATDFEVARMLGFEPFATVEEAIAEAERLLGKDCSISYPEMVNNFICKVE